MKERKCTTFPKTKKKGCMWESAVNSCVLYFTCERTCLLVGVTDRRQPGKDLEIHGSDPNRDSSTDC